MGSRSLLLLRLPLPLPLSSSSSSSPLSLLSTNHKTPLFSFRNRPMTMSSFSSFSVSQIQAKTNGSSSSSSSSSSTSSLPPPDVLRLSQTARISLTPQEVDEFAPKIRQVTDWFGQLQAVDLNSVEPAIRADTEGDNFRDDISETFENREAVTAAIPSYEEPFIKVPKVLNKE